MQGLRKARKAMVEWMKSWSFLNVGKGYNITIHESFFLSDARGLQISANFEADIKSQTRNDAIIRFKTAQNADKIFGKTVEKIQYEDHVSHLH